MLALSYPNHQGELSRTAQARLPNTVTGKRQGELSCPRSWGGLTHTLVSRPSSTVLPSQSTGPPSQVLQGAGPDLLLSNLGAGSTLPSPPEPAPLCCPDEVQGPLSRQRGDKALLLSWSALQTTAGREGGRGGCHSNTHTTSSPALWPSGQLTCAPSTRLGSTLLSKQDAWTLASGEGQG